jgi:hypothetical protein
VCCFEFLCLHYLSLFHAKYIPGQTCFLHPVGSFRIFEISESQIQQFIRYVQQLAETQDLQPPFPLHAEKYTYRVDPFDAMALNIYRDKYERILPKERPARCVQRLADFPELQDAIVQVNRDNSS